MIDRRTPLQENCLQQMTDQITGKDAKFAKTIQWNVYSFSDVLLSSLSLLPFYPTAFPQKQPELASSVFYTSKTKLMMEGNCVGEATCVDINQYTTNPIENKEKKEEDENVTVIGDSYLIVVNGTRMLLSKEEYEKEKNSKKQVPIEEVESTHLLTIDAVQEMKELNLVQLYHNPYYLLCCSSVAFIQLLHSLVLHQQVISVYHQDQHWIGIPFTSTSLYLFAEDVGRTIPMTKQMDCSSLFKQNTNDLFFFWNSSNPSHTFPQDIANTSHIQKLTNTIETSIEEDAFIDELRTKLQNASVGNIIPN